MGKALIMAAANDGDNVANATFYSLGCFLNENAVEANRSVYFGKAGTLSKMGCNVDATGGSRSLTTRKNVANGNQVITIADAASGIQEDLVNTDSVSVADLIAVAVAETGTNPTFYWVRYIFEATANHATIFANCSATSFLTDSVTRYGPLGGQVKLLATIGDAQCTMRAPGTLSRLSVVVTSNTRITNSTIGLDIGGSAGNNIVTITAGVTGVFTDTTNSDTISDGTLACFYATNSTGGGTLAWQLINCTFENTTNNKNDVIATGNTTRAASATVHYLPIGGSNRFDVTTESQAAVTHGFAGTISRLRMNLSANTYTVAATVRLRKNTGDGNQVLTLTASTTGLFEDTTNTDTFISTDTINLSIVGGTSGNITAQWWAVTEEETAAPPGGGITSTTNLHAISSGAATPNAVASLHPITSGIHGLKEAA